jgi:hypothetical protein
MAREQRHFVQKSSADKIFLRMKAAEETIDDELLLLYSSKNRVLGL